MALFYAARLESECPDLLFFLLWLFFHYRVCPGDFLAGGCKGYRDDILRVGFHGFSIHLCGISWGPLR
ncbi:MAG: hypothetical protein IKD53_11965 [Clostridia bacterium]|nr:hypothetical protein [Clostridia bacterium]